MVLKSPGSFQIGSVLELNNRRQMMSTAIYTPTKAKQGDRIIDYFMDIWE